jgi:hypothetical protein
MGVSPVEGSTPLIDRRDADPTHDLSDETTLIDSTAVDDHWSAGYVGLYRGDETTAQQFDDFQVGLDNNGDGEFAGCHATSSACPCRQPPPGRWACGAAIRHLRCRRNVKG